MSQNIDYTTIAIITAFTTVCATVSAKVADEVILFIKNKLRIRGGEKTK